MNKVVSVLNLIFVAYAPILYADNVSITPNYQYVEPEPLVKTYGFSDEEIQTLLQVGAANLVPEYEIEQWKMRCMKNSQCFVKNRQLFYGSNDLGGVANLPIYTEENFNKYESQEIAPNNIPVNSIQNSIAIEDLIKQQEDNNQAKENAQEPGGREASESQQSDNLKINAAEVVTNREKINPDGSMGEEINLDGSIKNGGSVPMSPL